MAVTLSPLGGAAGQFFSNAGVPLAGGKIYTYAAGTTTNKATYTTSSGATAHTNPIILDSNGRIPGGEIWLLSTDSYKFVIKDSTDVLLGTYDNLAGGATSIALDQLIANLASPTGATMVGYGAGTVATALARETWEEAGLRVNAIAPGLMRGPATQRMVASDAAAKQIAATFTLYANGVELP